MLCMAKAGVVFVFVGCGRGFPPPASVLELGVAGPWGEGHDDGERPLGAILRRNRLPSYFVYLSARDACPAPRTCKRCVLVPGTLETTGLYTSSEIFLCKK